MRSSSVAPPLVELGRLVGWDPLPLSVRDARRQVGPAPRAARAATPPRRRAAPRPAPRTASKRPSAQQADRLVRTRRGARRCRPLDHRPARSWRSWGGTVRASPPCSTTLSGCAGRPAGAVVVDGRDPQSLRAGRPGPPCRPRAPGPGAPSLRRERAATSAARPTRCPAWRQGRPCARSTACCPACRRDRHPRDLSEGQRLALALAIVVAPSPAAPAARRADQGSGLPEQGSPHRRPARVGRRRSRHRAGHP